MKAENGPGSQMHFTGQSTCPKFEPNLFRRDVCQICQSKIQSHSTATEEQISAALEYAVDRVWEGTSPVAGNVYLGGYKAALNVDFLLESSVVLVVNAAPSLRKVMGPRYAENRRKAWEKLKERGVEELEVDWEDRPSQKLEAELIGDVVTRIRMILMKGESVLVHCAQGKSRSSVIAAVFLLLERNLTVKEALSELRKKRNMAEPNPGFRRQLQDLALSGAFDRMKESWKLQ